ncbi:uncharacterized protein TEOVI_000279000 [Trypanosoma equiperdum]|nr:hypothetical protein, conserved [Trypanosoma equiperdum]
MSLQAVGWLSTKLGINIGGRGASGDGSTLESRPGSAGASRIDTCLHKLTDVVFGSGDNSHGGVGNLGLDAPFSGACNSGAHSACNSDKVELDENGLPVSKNWYYFDKELNRWNVSPDAPESIKAEFQQRLQEEELERSGEKAVPLPPPPPMQRGSSSFVGAPLSRVNQGGQPFVSGLSQQPGSYGHGPFGTQRSTGNIPHRPQYALPDYFATTSAPTPGPESYSQVAQQHFSSGPQQPPYGSDMVNTTNLGCSPFPQQMYPQSVPHPPTVQQPPLSPQHTYQQQFSYQSQQPSAIHHPIASVASGGNHMPLNPDSNQTQWQLPPPTF